MQSQNEAPKISDSRKGKSSLNEWRSAANIPLNLLRKEKAKLRTDTKKRENALRGKEILYNGEFDPGSG